MKKEVKSWELIAKMFVIENIILGFFALLLAIPLGFLFSQFISLIVVKALGIPEVVFIALNPVFIASLIAYFAAIYILVLWNMLRKIGKMSIYNFLYLDKQNEKKMFRNSKKRNIIFVISVIIGIASLVSWDSRFNLKIISNNITLTYLMVSVTGLIISIYGISATGSDMFLSVLLKSKNLKYQKDNLFVARTFASKARTMSYTIGTLSMLILLSLLALNMSGISKGIYESTLKEIAPYDIAISDDKNIFPKYMEIIEEEYTVSASLEYTLYKEPKNSVHKFYDKFYNYDPVMKWSDYKRLWEMRGFDIVSLPENEYIILSGNSEKYVIENNKSVSQIQLSNEEYLKLNSIDTDVFWYDIVQEGYCIIVVPDKYTEGLEVLENHLIVDTKEETTASFEKELDNKMAYHLCKNAEDKKDCQNYRTCVRGTAIEKQNAGTAIMASVCLYTAFIFISVVGTILAVQSLSDSAKYKYRYLTLRRLGINDKALYKTVRKQLFILFGVPVVYSVICSFWMLTSINKIYQLLLENNFTYLLYFAGSLGLFFLIYGVYWIAAYIGFKRNINEES